MNFSILFKNWSIKYLFDSTNTFLNFSELLNLISSNKIYISFLQENSVPIKENGCGDVTRDVDDVLTHEDENENDLMGRGTSKGRSKKEEES